MTCYQPHIDNYYKVTCVPFLLFSVVCWLLYLTSALSSKLSIIINWHKVLPRQHVTITLIIGNYKILSPQYTETLIVHQHMVLKSPDKALVSIVMLVLTQRRFSTKGVRQPFVKIGLKFLFSVIEECVWYV